jgi:hypothetical protein
METINKVESSHFHLQIITGEFYFYAFRMEILKVKLQLQTVHEIIFCSMTGNKILSKCEGVPCGPILRQMNTCIGVPAGCHSASSMFLF